MQDVAAAPDFVVSADHAGDGFGVSDVLFGENAGGEGVGVVGFEYGDGTLQNDCAVVQVLIDKMDGATGYFYAVFEGLSLCFEAGKGGKQRGVDVEDAVGEGGDEGGREEAHVAGEDDEVDVVLAEGGEHVGVVVGAGAAFGGAELGGQAQGLGGGEAGGAGDVGEDEGDFYVGEPAFADGLMNGEEVGAAAGEEDAETERRACAKCGWFVRSVGIVVQRRFPKGDLERFLLMLIDRALGSAGWSFFTE